MHKFPPPYTLLHYKYIIMIDASNLALLFMQS